MPSTRELTRRIKSVKSTRKITRAMQLVSAAKMRKAQNATLTSRSYVQRASELIASIGGLSSTESPLLQQFPEAKKVGVVLVTTNRGLVGSFNTNLFNALRREQDEDAEILSELIVVGKKGKEMAQRTGKVITAEFDKTEASIGVRDVYSIAWLLNDAYKSGKYKKIVLLYNEFVSTLVQTPVIKPLLPLTEIAKQVEGQASGSILEPDRKTVVDHLLPRIIESQLYQAILESDASEHSARMVMMKNATEAAGDLIDDLTLTYNQLRQGKITTELSEITAGKIALEKSK